MRTIPLFRRRVPLLALLLIALPALAALTERYYFEVPLERETSLRAEMDLALGRVTVGKAEPGYLFQAEVALENEEMMPEFDYSTEGRAGQLELGLASGGKGGSGLTVRGINIPEDNEWLLFFSDRIDLDLAFELGMTDADLDFTGLRVGQLSVESGMAKTSLTFDQPNPVLMSRFDVEAGMTRLESHKLGNARFEEFHFEGGAGSFALDFTGGPLPVGATADIEVGVSTLNVVLPRDTPVVLYAPESWLAQVEIPNGYIKHSKGVWYSAQVTQPEEAFTVRIEAGVGRVAVNVE